LGGADKASLSVDGSPLVEHALAALRGVSPLVLVGPKHLARPGVVLTREDPPHGGPAAALAAGMRALDAWSAAPEVGAVSAADGETAAEAPSLVWLLACDLPRAGGLVGAVRSALAARPLAPDEDGMIVRDAGGRDQWLAGIYRVAALRNALTALGDADGAPLRRVVGRLRLRRVDDAAGDAVDLDTWDDVGRYTRRVAAPNREAKPMFRTPPPELAEWIADVAPALGLDPAAVPAALLLDLTRDVAHAVTRPAGPVTTYLIGQAVATGADAESAAATVAARVEAWREAHPRAGGEEA